METIKISLKKLKWIILIAILVLNIYLSSYHLDYPVIGYHNWKETHYLTEARNFARDGFFEHGFFIPVYDYPDFKTDPSGAHSDTFPTTSIIVGLAFKIFGFQLWVARLVNVLFAAGSVLIFYLIIEKLFKRTDIAILSALLMAINPLLVFFGRQVQLINAALFFSLLGTYFYLKWLHSFSWKHTVIFSISLFLGIITKYTFALLLFPLFFIFPFKKLKEKKYWGKIAVVIAIGFLFFLWTLYSATISVNIKSQVTAIELDKIFDSNFWQTMNSYARDNYSMTGLLFSVIGIILFLVNIKKNYKSGIGYKFFSFYLIGSVIWFVILSSKLSGHNYHQYPFIPLIVFFMAYMLLVVGATASSLIKMKNLKWVVFLVLFLTVLSPSIESKNRMFDTQFYGLDIAGEYVNRNKLPGDRAIHSSHQAYGFLWHADLKGTSGIPKEIEKIKFAEENLSASWIFIYQWDFDIFQDEEVWGYISNSYSLKQAAFINNGQLQPLYFLLRKGGEFDINKLNDILQEQPARSRNYELSGGQVKISYITLE